MALLRAVLGVLSKAQEVVFGGELSDTGVTEANFFGKVLEVLTEHLVQEGALLAFPGSAQCGNPQSSYTIDYVNYIL